MPFAGSELAETRPAQPSFTRAGVGRRVPISFVERGVEER
jgi:hypothetical protein